MFWQGGIDVTIRNTSKNHIDMEIKNVDGGQWRFTGIYGESRAELKHETWSLLRDLYAQHAVNPLPWLCAGDFNEILFHHEKEGVSQEDKSAWIVLGRLWSTVNCMISASRVMFLRGGISSSGRRTTSGRDWIERWQLTTGENGFHWSM